MKQRKTSAIILRRTNFGEADRILSLLTPEGKISAIARGVRKQKSKLAGGVEIFALNEVVLIEGKSDIQTISSARMKTFFGNILKDLDRTEFTYFMLKDISRKAENIGSGEFFDITSIALSSLNEESIFLQIIESWYFIRVAEILGEGINLNYDQAGRKLSADKTYNFDFYEKVFMEDENGEFNDKHIKYLRLLSSSTPKIITKIVGVKDINKQVSEIIRSVEVKI
jgi:DNA repair protein RecO (recombination protein O)